MKKEQSRLDSPNQNTIESVKSPYSSPTLHIYGTVSKLTSGSAGSIFDGQGMPHTMSDRLTKDNIIQIDTHWLGIGLYLFNYRPQYQEYGQGRQFGVMADEVETVMPSALSTHPDGYKMVNYAMLGITQEI